MLSAETVGGPFRTLVVMVCAGNICRSPVAEAMARQIFTGTGWRFSSAGLRATPGQGPTELAARLAAEEGLDLSGHLSRGVDRETMVRAAWLLAMTRGQAAQLRALADRPDAPAGGLRIGVLGAPGIDLLTVRHSPVCEEVADPWGGDEDIYRATAAQIRRLLGGWLPVLATDPCSGKG